MRRDLVHADLIEAGDALLVARRALQEMLSQLPDKVASLNDNRFPTPPLEPSTMSDWVSKAEADNPVVHARQRALDVADKEVSHTYGDHLPTLDLVLSYNAADSETVSTRNQRNRYGLAGLQLSIPIFTGGRVSAQARQAVANRNKASEELYAMREEVISNTTREFRGVQSSEARIRALETAIVSSERALYSTRKGFQAGTSTNVDILNAEEQVYDARRQVQIPAFKAAPGWRGRHARRRRDRLGERLSRADAVVVIAGVFAERISCSLSVCRFHPA